MIKLEELLTHICNKHVFIQTHNFPDPDAIASAFGLQKLLEAKGIEATICYSGKIDRYSTSMMTKLFNIEISNISDLQSVKMMDEVILVDSQKGNSNIINMTGDEIICIDHHQISDESSNYEKSYRFSDIGPRVGACASIIAEYYFENDIPMDENVATALCYGIKMDTSGFSRGVAPLDIQMFYRLFNQANHDLISNLEHSVLKLDDLKAYAEAINSINVVGDAGFANAGHNCPEALIASVSDFILQLKEVSFSVVYSFKEDGVKLSIRSSAAKFNAGVITESALMNVGSGGGHPQMAGGFVPYVRIGQKKETLDEKQVADFIMDIFLKKLS